MYICIYIEYIYIYYIEYIYIFIYTHLCLKKSNSKLEIVFKKGKPSLSNFLWVGETCRILCNKDQCRIKIMVTYL